MVRLIRLSLLAGLVLGSLVPSFAQQSEYGYFYLRGTYSRPQALIHETNFSDQTENGLFALNGGGFEAEVGKYINYWGLGGFFSANFFGMDDPAFRDTYGAIAIQRQGGISTVNFGFGPVVSVPIVEDYWYWHTGVYGGFRIVGVPREIQLRYAETDSRFTQVTYAVNSNVSGFYQASTGFSVYFSDYVGLDLNAGYTGGGINSFDYDYVGTGSKDVMGTDRINQRIDYLNFQVGVAVKWN